MHAKAGRRFEQTIRRHSIVSSLLSCRYVDCATDYSADVASLSCQLVRTSMWESIANSFYFTETIISDHVSSVQRVNCRENIAATKGNYSAPQNIRTSKAKCASRLGPGMSISAVGGLRTCLHFPRFAGHFHLSTPTADTALLSSILTAAVTRALRSCITSVPRTTFDRRRRRLNVSENATKI